MTLSDNGEQLRIYYPTVLSSSIGYLRDHVLLEFGIRNEINPQEKNIIKPYILETIDSKIKMPMPSVDTLSPVRTFWEKATLAHVECHRNKLQQSPDRLSRHWYDLFILNQSWVGKAAIQDMELLEKVIKHKKAFFNASYANYDACLQGTFRIVPEESSLIGLENDYSLMSKSGMFINKPPSFDAIIDSLKTLETTLQKKYAKENSSLKI